MVMLNKWPHHIVHIGSEGVYWEIEKFLVAYRQFGETVVIPKIVLSTALGDKTAHNPGVEM